MNERVRILTLSLGATVVLTAVHAMALSVQQSVSLAASVFSAGSYYGLLLGLAVPLWLACAALGHTGRSWWWTLSGHFALFAATVTVWNGGYFGLLYVTAGPEALRNMLTYGGVWMVLQSLTTYTMLVAGIVLVQNQHRLAHQRRKEAELRALAQQAELRAIRAQLRPHFIFNVLNSIYALIPAAPDNAQRMVERVADLIRDTLDVTDQKLIPLEQELTLVDRYLGIEALRIGDRLRVEKDISPDVTTWPVPPLILQPLVENAVKHGVSRSTVPGRIRIQADANDAHLTIRITSSGPPDMPRRPDGKGLSITKSRLETMYGAHSHLDIDYQEDDHVEVAMTVPLHA